MKSYIKDKRPCLTAFPNTEKRAENTTHCGVFVTNFELFETLVNLIVSYVFAIETKTKKKTEKQNGKNICLLRSDIQTPSSHGDDVMTAFVLNSVNLLNNECGNQILTYVTSWPRLFERWITLSTG